MGIYLIQSEELVKIGFTSNMKKRLSQYKLHNPKSKLLYHCERGGLDFEAIIHGKFKHKKDSGEWFKLSEADIKDCISFIEKEIVSYRSSREKVLDYFINDFMFVWDLRGTQAPRIRIEEKGSCVIGYSNNEGAEYIKKDDVLFTANTKGGHDTQMMFEPYDHGDCGPFEEMYRIENHDTLSFYELIEKLYLANLEAKEELALLLHPSS
jgi:hypothetical protein